MRPVAMTRRYCDADAGGVDWGTCTASVEYFDVVSDRRGAPVVLLDSDGDPVWLAKYTPYGQTYDEESFYGGVGDFKFNLRLPGQYFDSETGWYYNGQRYYIPEMRRYNRPEPIGQAGSLDLYMYAGGNPVMNIDPTGLDEIDVEDVDEPVGGDVEDEEEGEWEEVVIDMTKMPGEYERRECNYDTLECRDTVEYDNTGQPRYEYFRHPKGARQDFIVEEFGDAEEGSAEHTLGAFLYYLNEFTDEEPSFSAGGGIKKQGVKQLKKSIRSWSKRMDEHIQKLDDYIKKPLKYDNDGRIRRNLDKPEVVDDIIKGRTKHLQNEIDNFKKLIEEAEKQL